MIDDGDAIGEALDFGERVRGEENRGGAGLQNLRFEEAAELRRGDNVEAAGGFVQQEQSRAMQQCASQTDALHRAGRERADLTVEKFAENKLCGQGSSACLGVGAGQAIELAEEQEILASGEPWIQAMIGARVIAEVAPDGARLGASVVAGHLGLTARGKQKGGDNAQQGRFSGTVGAKQRDGFALANFQGNV